MAGISTPGIGSGLDVNGLVSKLMAVEQQPLTKLATREAGFQAKISAFGSINGVLSALQTAAQTLTSSLTFTGTAASVSDPTVLSASTGGGAAAGSYSLSVTQLATSHIVSSDPLNLYATTADTFHTGTLAISIGGGTATNVTIDSSNNTLAGIRQAINDANAGVNATIINDGTTNRLVLSSNTSGSVGAITVAATDLGGPGSGTHALSELGSGLVLTQAAVDANLSINGLAITRSSNTITDAINGVTLNLTKGTVAAPGTAMLTVARNTTATTSAITTFVTAYNAAVAQLKSSSAFNTTANTASALTGDSTVRSVLSQLASLVQANVTGVSGGISRLSDIGIAVQKDGTLATNTAKLQAALSDPNTDVATLFRSTSTGNTGVAVRFNDLLSGIVGSTGLLAARTNGITSSITSIGKQRVSLNLRLANVEKRYRAQFTALDTLISSMQTTSTYLTQQLASLPGVVSTTK